MTPLKILVIDDEQSVCDGCRLVLSEQGHSVSYCKTGTDGLLSFREVEPDVVLLDMKLPDKDGMEILHAITAEKPGTYVIVLTGYSSVRNAVDAMKAGAFDYLAKPFTEDELASAVRKAEAKKRLREENLSLRNDLCERSEFNTILGDDPKILKILRQIHKVAPTGSTVLITGESGTGKELFARAVHTHSRRAGKRFMAVDCSALSPGLLESELFGHVKGAFTGAVQDKPGIFEVAHGGTLFLDDVANLSLDIQAKLLRVLEVYEYKPVGASNIKKTDVRIIAATNKDLKEMVDKGDFREDLFYRLNVVPVFLPPLRDRKADIPKLAYFFLRHFRGKTGRKVDGFSDEALEALVNYKWPGNVRQLRNVIERLVIMADRDTLDLPYLMDHIQVRRLPSDVSIPRTVEELKATKRSLIEEDFSQIEKAFLMKALKDSKGNITKAARRVGMQRSNFSTLLKKHQLSAEAVGFHAR